MWHIARWGGARGGATLPVEHPIQGYVVFLVLVISNRYDLLEALDEEDQHEQGEGNGPQVDDETKPTDHDEGEDAPDPPFPPATSDAR